MSPRRSARERMSALPDERELVERSRGGDLEAFNCLVAAYQDRVYNLCRRMLGSPEAAADATQETFLSAYRSVGSLRSAAVKSWLFRIASNACIDEIRRHRRQAAVSLDAPSPDADPDRTLDLPDPTESPERAALRSELSEALQAELLRLPPDQRLAVILCDLQGLGYGEIAASMGGSVGTVKSRISRGRARLRERLRARPELFGDIVRQER